ncbi:MAG: hypothetical protein GY757_45055 [bacterium]|nr:hypothetical protein [bacterium]
MRRKKLSLKKTTIANFAKELQKSEREKIKGGTIGPDTIVIINGCMTKDMVVYCGPTP